MSGTRTYEQEASITQEKNALQPWREWRPLLKGRVFGDEDFKLDPEKSSVRKGKSPLFWGRDEGI